MIRSGAKPYFLGALANREELCGASNLAARDLDLANKGAQSAHLESHELTTALHFYSRIRHHFAKTALRDAKGILACERRQRDYLHSDSLNRGDGGRENPLFVA